MESTTRNMWKLIYDRKCGVVVMLSDLLEDGMVNCGFKKQLYIQHWVVGALEYNFVVDMHIIICFMFARQQ